MMRTVRMILGVALVAALLPGAAKAEFLYSYAFGQDTYTVTPGETFLVDVFLQETVTGGEPPRLADDGLFGAGVRVHFDEAPAQVIGLDDILPNTAEFDDALFLFTDLVPGVLAEFTEVIDLLSPPVFGTEVSPDVFRVFLGSFRFTAGLTPGQGFIFALDIPETDDTITDAGFLLDPLILPASATITVVPEPSTLTLLGIGVLGIAGHAVQRRRRSPAS